MLATARPSCIFLISAYPGSPGQRDIKRGVVVVCLEAGCKEDATKKLMYKAGIADQVLPEEVTEMSLLKLSQLTDTSVHFAETTISVIS